MFPKEKRVILKGKKYTEFRWKVYERAGGLCERCGRSTPFDRGEARHVKGRGMGGGKRNDIVELAKWLCNCWPNYCHHHTHNPKACPPKVRK